MNTFWSYKYINTKDCPKNKEWKDDMIKKYQLLPTKSYLVGGIKWVEWEEKTPLFIIQNWEVIQASFGNLFVKFL